MFEIIHGGYSTKARKIIDMETLEVYQSVHDASRKLKCNASNITRNINVGWKIMGKKLEYFDEWILLDDKEKQKYSVKNNIYFMKGCEYNLKKVG